MFTQQSIQVVADHELDTWDYSFKDLTATVQFKSMKMSFLHTDLQGCKDFESKLMSARAIFGTARIPADNLINALIDAGYKLVKTEVNRPSNNSMQLPSLGSGYITAMTNSDKRLMSDMHNVKLGGTIEASTPYRIGEAGGTGATEVFREVAQKQFEDSGASRNRVIPLDAKASGKQIYTVHLSTPSSRNESFADAVMEALVDLTNDSGFK
ncbi:hypothetical protein bas27_0178 [Escherichia phage TrudiGerster]|uniref:Uncharacterized protein n=1 Tax=Escherichia phage TrudiGerster TaxID=2851991 RepID=A0AAE7VZU9_9CAUD|nr:hypothetical protein bas27_0178 [Escherichia phage TrudiGerster]